jgi:hypothetical protein
MMVKQKMDAPKKPDPSTKFSNSSLRYANAAGPQRSTESVVHIHPRALLTALAECLESLVTVLRTSDSLYDPLTPFNVASSVRRKHFKINVDPTELKAATRGHGLYYNGSWSFPPP